MARKPSAMGRAKEFGLSHGQGKGSVPRTDTNSPAYQANIGECKLDCNFTGELGHAVKLTLYRSSGFTETKPGHFRKVFK